MSVSSAHVEDSAYEQLARVGKALSSAPRLLILDVLGQGPRTVETLSREVRQSVANTSHHLQVLRRAKLVEADRRGARAEYRLADEDVGALLQLLRRVAESRLLELREILLSEDWRALSPVDRDALVERVRRGDVLVLDVRPVEEYRSGHVRGAVSVPLAELERRLSELPRDRTIVAYCRGRYCVLAADAVRMLRARGFDAVRMEDGVPDLKARGLPVDTEAIA